MSTIHASLPRETVRAIRERPPQTEPPIPATRIAIAVIALALVAAACGQPVEPGPRSERPNIVVIMTDDQEPGSLAHMPIVAKRLAARGMRFENSFVTTPRCCPSRASFLTGRYAHNHGVLRNVPPGGGWQAFVASGSEADTLAVWLKAAGYRTAIAGRYLTHYDDGTHVAPGWDEWHVAIGRGGFEGYHYQLSENGKIVSYGGEEKDHLTNVATEKALAFIEAGESDDSRPFFLYVATTAPHGPWVYERRDRKKFKGVTAPRPPSFREADMTDKPPHMQRLKEMPDDRLEKVDTWYRGYLRSLAGVDRAVDRILDALDRFDETRDTYVIFTSDNGFLFGEHWDIGKLSPYEPSIRVPLIVRGPDVRPRAVAGELALNVDLAPTLMEIAGAPAHEALDGRSLVPLLRERAGTGWRDDFLIEQLDFEEKPDAEGDPQLPPYIGVRTERYVYVEYLGSAGGERELYDLEVDPYQMENLAGKAEVAEIEGRLAARVAELRGCRGQECR